MERDRLLIRHAAHYAEHGVDLRLGFPAVSIDRGGARVEIADGIARRVRRAAAGHGQPSPPAAGAGSRTRRRALPAHRRGCRPAARANFSPGRRAVIIGGGYIGLEVAATCREAGLDVTVLEAADRVMSRVVAPEVSRFYEAEHARHGVKILCGARVATAGAGTRGSPIRRSPRPAPNAWRRCGWRTAAKSPPTSCWSRSASYPTDALAREAGLDCDNGIVVNEYCRTSDPGIWAAGDCARHPSIHFGMRVRLESVDNAFEQGTSAALNMLGTATVHDKVPWFWSDQFDLKMVIVGPGARATTTWCCAATRRAARSASVT